MKKPIPNLRITHIGGRNLGRCYNANCFEVVSRTKLTTEVIQGLWKLGLIGSGQEFHMGEIVEKSETEVYGPEEYNTREYGRVYVCRSESRVDSSD